ncbi:hypothetical protein PR048_002048 [Dryococelus australis]|uniref:Uncharacterized protein n=1 Tax=Dryococelus australis TaxID=614101 RepID=A0ABQ9IJ43_9NEOP|nr:hypothetical protein PR048_002048 [Dryococelus australis]
MKVTPDQSVTNKRDNCKDIVPENTLKSKSSGDDNSDMNEEQIWQQGRNVLFLKPIKRKIGEYAMYCYEEDLFPGVITHCNDHGARISAMKPPDSKSFGESCTADLTGGSSERPAIHRAAYRGYSSRDGEAHQKRQDTYLHVSQQR